eukprot:TRINITY_DN9105_c0_g1_i3.p2 TRINITY_DN9105_c0_g1~~TRINITY_DN9105_c0_g1_i3.p2  ORF type:complete len:141 (-),score=46.43 TRINITY_DN9105_c0_g1_i3:259-681(-)
MLGFNALMQKYSARGFTVLGMANNQFGYQCPGNATEILESFRYVRPGAGYAASFPILAKADVNGADTDAIFAYAKGVCPFNGNTQIMMKTDLIVWSPVRTTDIVWNFEKFLISRNGTFVRRYSPFGAGPTDLAADIEALL